MTTQASRKPGQSAGAALFALPSFSDFAAMSELNQRASAATVKAIDVIQTSANSMLNKQLDVVKTGFQRAEIAVTALGSIKDPAELMTKQLEISTNLLGSSLSDLYSLATASREGAMEVTTNLWNIWKDARTAE